MFQALLVTLIWAEPDNRQGSKNNAIVTIINVILQLLAAVVIVSPDFRGCVVCARPNVWSFKLSAGPMDEDTVSPQT